MSRANKLPFSLLNIYVTGWVETLGDLSFLPGVYRTSNHKLTLYPSMRKIVITPEVFTALELGTRLLVVLRASG